MDADMARRAGSNDGARALADLAEELVRDATDRSKLRRRRRRLLLLCHAQKCHDPRCDRHRCAETKELLQHMQSCPHRKQGGCDDVEGCRDSCTLLEHFYWCDGPCRLCDPVCKCTVEEYWGGTRRRLDFPDFAMEEFGGTTRKLTF